MKTDELIEILNKCRGMKVECLKSDNNSGETNRTFSFTDDFKITIVQDINTIFLGD